MATKNLKSPVWVDRREARQRKDLISHLKSGGAIFHRESGEIYCSPRECPADLHASPYSYRKCTHEDLMADQAEDSYENEKEDIGRWQS